MQKHTHTKIFPPSAGKLWQCYQFGPLVQHTAQTSADTLLLLLLLQPHRK